MTWVDSKTFDSRRITALCDDSRQRCYGHYERLENGTFALPPRQGKRRVHTTSESDVREEIVSAATALAFEDLKELAQMMVAKGKEVKCSTENQAQNV